MLVFKNDTDWKYAIDVCTHGAVGLTRLYFEISERIKEIANVSLNVTHHD
jgi:hypothetical protein